MRMKRFSPELVDTELKLAQRFVLGLDKRIHSTVETIVPTIIVALRAAKATKGNISEKPRRPPPSTVVVEQK